MCSCLFFFFFIVLIDGLVCMFVWNDEFSLGTFLILPVKWSAQTSSRRFFSFSECTMYCIVYLGCAKISIYTFLYLISLDNYVSTHAQAESFSLSLQVKTAGKYSRDEWGVETGGGDNPSAPQRGETGGLLRSHQWKWPRIPARTQHVTWPATRLQHDGAEEKSHADTTESSKKTQMLTVNKFILMLKIN